MHMSLAVCIMSQLELAGTKKLLNSPFLFLQHKYQKMILASKRTLATQARPQNRIEKIVQKYTVNATGKVYSGDFVAIQPHHCMTHDNTGPVISK